MNRLTPCLIIALSLCTSILASGCRHSTLRLDNGVKLRARVLDADAQNVYVLTPEEKILTVRRSKIVMHKPPGKVTTALGGFQALSTLFVLVMLREELEPGAGSLFFGIMAGSAATAFTGMFITRDARARYRRGLTNAPDARTKRVRIEPVLGTGSSHQAGFRLRF